MGENCIQLNVETTTQKVENGILDEKNIETVTEPIIPQNRKRLRKDPQEDLISSESEEEKQRLVHKKVKKKHEIFPVENPVNVKANPRKIRDSLTLHAPKKTLPTPNCPSVLPSLLSSLSTEPSPISPISPISPTTENKHKKKGVQFNPKIQTLEFNTNNNTQEVFNTRHNTKESPINNNTHTSSKVNDSLLVLTNLAPSVAWTRLRYLFSITLSKHHVTETQYLLSTHTCLCNYFLTVFHNRLSRRTIRNLVYEALKIKQWTEKALASSPYLFDVVTLPSSSLISSPLSSPLSDEDRGRIFHCDTLQKTFSLPNEEIQETYSMYLNYDAAQQTNGYSRNFLQCPRDARDRRERLLPFWIHMYHYYDSVFPVYEKKMKNSNLVYYLDPALVSAILDGMNVDSLILRSYQNSSFALNDISSTEESSFFHQFQFPLIEIPTISAHPVEAALEQNFQMLAEDFYSKV